ncbi:hypothetical protein BASA50_005349 [Batrachochytrium salamandrivorans]|uniref:Uncharacterized protein n=1 Tax=Batrachochytrium salamandrivorans TaxID=1357716 RepID=A0ABQ8FFV4_9FUNG|nr:hypothetical protein BASA50_005349 [Batrachochytrium salamandrivorans]
MKVRVLVAAAMVITSINADGDGGFLSCLGISCRSGSESSSYKWSRRTRLKPIKKDPKCHPIVEELHTSREKLDALDHRFRTHAPDFHKLMMGEITKGKKGKKHNLNPREIQKYIEANPEAIPGLREIKVESISLKEGHLGIWEKLLGNDCPTGGLKRLSPENMEKEGHFLDWYDNNGMDILSKQ